MNIPALDVDGACLSIIGQLDESRGVLIFASLDDFEQFLKATEPDAVERGSSLLGTELLALTFEAATVLPASMRREAMEHGWAVASADAYPLVERRDLDGAPRPLVERDVEIATACALSLSAFFAKRAAIFKSDTFAPVCESYFDDDGVVIDIIHAAEYVWKTPPVFHRSTASSKGVPVRGPRANGVYAHAGAWSELILKPRALRAQPSP